MGAVWNSSFCVRPTEAKRQGDGPGILQPAETLLFSFLSLLQPACKTGPWPSNAPFLSITQPFGQSVAHLRLGHLTRKWSESGREEEEEREKALRQPPVRSRWAPLLLSHLICLSEAHIKSWAEKQRVGSFPRRDSLKPSVMYLSGVIWLPTHGRDSLTAWEIPSSFKAFIGGKGYRLFPSHFLFFVWKELRLHAVCGWGGTVETGKGGRMPPVNHRTDVRSNEKRSDR